MTNKFEDLREFICVMDSLGELARVKTEVSLVEELGAIVRKTWDCYGDASPVLLFENLSDYPPPGPSKLLVGTAARYRRLGLLLGMTETFHPREIVQRWLQKIRKPVPPVVVPSGPCKENKDLGDKVNLFKFPTPLWHHRDGGRYIGTLSQVVTRDPLTGWVNVGNYRLQLHDERTLGILLVPGRQHIGLHFAKYIAEGQPMPVSIAIGGPPACSIVAMSPFPAGVCEYDIAGALQGEAVYLTKSELSDLPVPESAEIVIEGVIDPRERKTEGPFGEYLGYYGEVPSPMPVIRVQCVTYRDDPILNGTLEGYPVRDVSHCSSLAVASFAWEILEFSGVPGVIDVAAPPSSSGGHVIVSIRSTMPGVAAMVASALWGTHKAHWAFKQVIVVDEDIDPWDLRQVDWAIWTRVKASEDIHIWPRTKGGNLDPRVPPEEKGLWDRVLIDATRPYHWEPRSVWGEKGVGKGEPLRFPPTARPEPDLMDIVNSKWNSYGIRPVEQFVGDSRGLFAHWWEPHFIELLRAKKVAP